jgi:hypothetical protein
MAESCLHSRNLVVHTQKQTKEKQTKEKKKKSKDIHQYTLHLHGVGSHWDMGLYLDMAESCLHSRNLVVHTQKQKKEQKKKAKKSKKACSTRGSKVVPHPSTNRA